MTINELAKEIHKNAVEHGWWDEPRSFGDIIALCHSELSEALEEYRSGNEYAYFSCGRDWNCVLHDPNGDNSECFGCPKHKPEGIAVEMADCIIRIFDWCGKENIDIEQIILTKHEYNKTRPYRHGGKALCPYTKHVTQAANTA